MKIRNWHKRNTRAARLMEGRFSVSAAFAPIDNVRPELPNRVQIGIHTEELGHARLSLTVDEARHMMHGLARSLGRCVGMNLLDDGGTVRIPPATPPARRNQS